VVPQLDAAARSGDPSLIRSCLDQKARATLPPDAPIFATPIGGMARVIDGLLALMPGVEMRVGRRVVGIELTGPSSVRVALDDGSTLDADAVVVASPAHAAGPLLASAAPVASEILGAIGHASVSMVTLAFDPGALTPDPECSGCLIPRDQGTLTTAVSYATNKWAQLRNPDRDDVILRASAGRFGDDRHLDLDDDDLVARMLADLDQVVGLRSGPTEVRVNRWPRSFPQYAPGHLGRMDVLDRSLVGLPVAVAGMALRGVGIPATIHSAELAAAALGAVWPTRT